MNKIILSFSLILLCLGNLIVLSYADSEPSVPAGEPLITINNQEMEKLFKDEEIILRKIKLENVHQKRQFHHFETAQKYREAVSLYQLQRPDHAKEVFGNVEYLRPYYKSTRVFLNDLDDQEAQEILQHPKGPKPLEDTQEAIDLAKRAAMLYQQAAVLEDDKDTVVIKKKLSNLKMALQQMTKQAYFDHQTQKIGQDADKYDQEIFKLTQAGEYIKAMKKYVDYQQAMIDDLTQLKQSMSSGKKQVSK